MFAFARNKLNCFFQVNGEVNLEVNEEMQVEFSQQEQNDSYTSPVSNVTTYSALLQILSIKRQLNDLLYSASS